MTRSVIEDRIQHPFVLPIVDGREDAIGALIAFIGSHVARKSLQRSVQKRPLHLAWCLFFPQPLPNSAEWQRAQTRGAHATGASWRVDRACQLRPPDAPPFGSLDACRDHRAAPHPSDRCCSAYGISNSNETRRSPEGHLGDQCINRPGRVRCVARIGGDRHDGGIGGRRCGRGYGCTPPIEALGGP